MKRIMFVCNRLGGGGAERVITILANKFANKGYESRFCIFRGVGNTYEINPSITITQLFEEGKVVNRIEKIRRLRNEIKRYKPDVIISFEYFVNMETIIAAYGLNSKVIISERNDPKRVGGKFPKNIIRNILYSFCDVLVCQTYDAKNYFPKFIQKNTVIIPNPIKENLPDPWLGERSKEIVNFCRLEKQKNLPLLIDAFEQVHKQHSEYTLHIYGDGKEKEFLEKYIWDKGLQGSAFIHSSKSDIHERVVKSAMFVSSSDYEGISNSMIEAMAIGLPCIVTDCPCGGARMMIDNRLNGILVPVGDTKSLYQEMKNIIENQELSNKLSINAENIKEKLKQDTICKMWEDLI